MPNRIINLAVHDLRKVDDVFEIFLRQGVLPVNDTTRRVVDELHDLYNRRASKAYGRFSVDDANYPTQGHLRTYMGDQDFLAFTARLMDTLMVQARRKAAAGGHVFFAHFERDDSHYLLVVIVTDKLGARLTGNLDVEDSEHLDMDGFRFAGRINITHWTRDEARYVGFLRGKGDVSEYFKEFLGCDTTTLDKEDTKGLVDALKDFAEAQGLQGERKDDFLNRAKAICERVVRDRTELSFEALANELVPNSPQTLLDVLTDADRRLNDRFRPNLRVLGALVKFKAKTPHWSVEFERDALTNGSIVFDVRENSLTFRDIPPELAAQLRAETE
jgi:nucleoid-associated protein